MQNNTSMESGTDQYDIASLEILNKCHLDLFPKKTTIYDDISTTTIIGTTANDYYCNIETKLLLLSGEYIQNIGKAGKLNEDIIVLTNYRLFLLLNNETSFINIPIMLIEYVEIREIFYIYVHLKNVKTAKIVFSTNEKCLLWYQRLISISSKIVKLDDLFAFRFYSWFINEKPDDFNNKAKLLDFDKFDPRGLIKQEFDRMKFDETRWRITRGNANHKLCPTYPELLIVPNTITDEQLQKIANFRSSRRFPTVVWKSKTNGCVIARSSQPNVGLLAWRSSEDEQLIKAIANNCTDSVVNTCYNTNGTNVNITDAVINGNDDPLQQQQQQDGILLIIDARCRSVALANRVKGGGYEYSEYYTNCEIQFMNLENIHVIRSSFQSLRTLCQKITDNQQFYSQLENTKWLQHLSGIIKAASTVVRAIDRHGKPVLIHCSDGWDRTPQVLALAKILLDPYYRTIKGFQILIELDWLMYGHQFAKRNGHAVNHTDVNERCPVFLQWLDCVYQLLKQYPNAFEFNEIFLLKLCYHSYSCLFGTFLCDSNEERCSEHIYERTFSVWSYLNNQNNKLFMNYLYDETFQEILYPKYEIANLQLWSRLFCDTDIAYLVSKIDQETSANSNTATTTTAINTVAIANTPSAATIPVSVLADGSTTISTRMSDLKAKINNDELDHNDLSFSFSPPTQILVPNVLSTSSSSSTSSAATVNESTNNLSSITTTTTTATNIQTTTTATTTTAAVNIINKNRTTINTRTRSFNDFTKFSHDSNENLHLNNLNINNNNSNNVLLLNDDPIQIRSSSESNLLADALENFGTTPITNSFIIPSSLSSSITTATNSNRRNSFSNSYRNNSSSVFLNGDLNINGDNNSSSNSSSNSSNNNSNNVNTATTTTTIDSSTPIILLNKLKFQKSTDTLVDDQENNNNNKNINKY